MNKLPYISSFTQGILKIIFVVSLFCLILFKMYPFSSAEKQKKESILIGEILIEAVSPHTSEAKTKIQPGTPVKISIILENRGSESTPAGDLYIQYVFPPPLHEELSSLVFQTEKISIPKLAPQKKTIITFMKTHHWPSITDFVRYDWAMRHYEAVFETTEQIQTIATLAMTYSAYYYPSIGTPLLP